MLTEILNYFSSSLANKKYILFARLGSLVGLALPASNPRTSGGSMGFPKYRLKMEKITLMAANVKFEHVSKQTYLNDVPVLHVFYHLSFLLTLFV